MENNDQNNFENPQDSYGSDPNGGQETENYGQEPNQYNQNSYGSDPNAYNNQYNQNGYGSDPNAYNNQYNQNGYGSDPNAYNNQYNQNGYGSDPNAYNNQYSQNGYGSNPNAYNNQYNQYGTNGYTSTNGYNGQYYAQQMPLDNNGQPMKNRFAMKLTFSILEMICGNIISLVCGIIACVYVCKQNNAYREGRWADFKSAAKAATISLWIGLGGFVLSIILVVVLIAAVGYTSILALAGLQDYYGYEDDYSYYGDDYGYSDDYDYNYDYGDDYDYDYDDDDTTVQEALPEVEGTGYTDPAFTLNGSLMTIPTGMSTFEEMGYHMRDEYIGETLAAGDYEFTTLYKEDSASVMVYLVNDSLSDLAYNECNVYGIVVSAYDFEDGGSFALNNGGIDFSTGKDEVLEIMGTPDYYTSSDETGYEYWEWYAPDDNNGYSKYMTIFFDDGEISEIDIMWDDSETN